MIKDLTELISEWDTCIRKGQGQRIKGHILKLKPGQIPSHQRAQVAQLARRLSLYGFALRLIYPIIKDHREKKLQASQNEIAEYAANLMEIGAHGEARRLLLDLVQQNHHHSRLVYAFSLFREWSYQDAIPHLETYISESESHYLKLVGQINLASAHVTLNHIAAAADLLRELQAECEKGHHQLLLGSCFELQAQIEFFNKNFGVAKDKIAQSESLLSSSQNIAHLYCQKWKCLIDLESHPNSPIHLEEIQKLKAWATEVSNWETLRDLDFRVSMIHQDQMKYESVYYGSRFPSYREHIQKLSQKNVAETFHWRHESNSQDLIMSPWEGKIEGFEKPLKKGQLLQKLLWTFASDHYSSFTYGTLFAELFGGQYFDPYSSAQRIFKLVQRLRLWLAEANYPAEITYNSGAFRLELKPGACIQKSKNQLAEPPVNYDLARLYAFPRQEFTSNDLAETLSVSKRQANRILKTAITQGLVSQIGRGPASRFKKVS